MIANFNIHVFNGDGNRSTNRKHAASHWQNLSRKYV